MLKSERQRLIVDKIAKERTVSLDDLVKLLDTSESTVRRDLDELETLGKLHRVHGGAEAIQPLQEELTNQQKSIKNVQEKRALAESAVHLIGDSEVIFIDAGTTTGFLVELLVERSLPHLTVVTNSIHHAARLVERGIRTIIVGGLVKATTDASIGSFAIEQLKSLNFDKAFLGMNAVDKAFVTTPDPEEAHIKKAIIDSAKQAYILADASKIGQFAFVKVAELAEVTLITNQTSQPLLKDIKQKTRVIEV